MAAHLTHRSLSAVSRWWGFQGISPITEHPRPLRLRPALIALLCTIVGILAGSWTDFSPAYLPSILILTALGLTGAAWWLNREKNLADWLLLTSMVLIGFLLSLNSGASPDESKILRLHTDSTIEVTARVVEEPVLNRTRPKLVAETITVDGKPLKARVLIVLPPEMSWMPQFGDHLRFLARVRRPSPARNPGEFDYRSYLRQKELHVLLRVPSGEGKIARLNVPLGVCQAGVRGVRSYIRRSLTLGMSAESGGLIRAMWLGDRNDLSDRVKRNFIESGLGHLFAVSGLHVGIIVGGLWAIGLLVIGRRKLLLILLLTFMIAYVWVTGFRPSVIRASILFGVILTSGVVERKPDFMNSLGVAALITLFIWPLSLFRLDFQLSYLAASAIGLIVLPIDIHVGEWIGSFRRHYWRFRLSRIGWKIILAAFLSLAVQLFTVPLTMHYFGYVAPLAVITDVVAYPLAAITLSLGTLSVAVGWIGPVCQLINGINSVLLEWLMGISEFFANIIWVTHFSTWSLIWAGMVIGFALWYCYAKRFWYGGVATLLLAVNLSIWHGVIFPEPDWRLTILDIGQGDAALLELPGGRAVLIDGGPGRTFFSRWDAGEGTIIPYLRYKGIDTLDVVFATHPDADHIGGLTSVLKAIPVRMLLHPGVAAETAAYHTLMEVAEKKNVAVYTVSAGDSVAGLGKIGISVLHPRRGSASHMDRNDASLVLKLSGLGLSALFTGDISTGVDREILAWGERLDSDILKVAHHGSKSSTSERFLRQVTPGSGIISAGVRNRYGHPSREVLQRLEAAGSKIWMTPRDGAVVIEGFFGERIKITPTITK